MVRGEISSICRFRGYQAPLSGPLREAVPTRRHTRTVCQVAQKIQCQIIQKVTPSRCPTGRAVCGHRSRQRCQIVYTVVIYASDSHRIEAECVARSLAGEGIEWSPLFSRVQIGPAAPIGSTAVLPSPYDEVAVAQHDQVIQALKEGDNLVEDSASYIDRRLKNDRLSHGRKRRLHVRSGTSWPGPGGGPVQPQR